MKLIYDATPESHFGAISLYRVSFQSFGSVTEIATPPSMYLLNLINRAISVNKSLVSQLLDENVSHSGRFLQ
uniref:Uncharacterized protein n=1 Tax=Rhizophagus irregularis (strain DAOM 181602 / DAOM 197198 / MUCL 43194) TaxID=747089 RepID=U9T445_RHIID